MHHPVILRHAVADLIERRDCAVQFFIERNLINGGGANDRAGKGIVGGQPEGGLGECLRRGEFVRPVKAGERRGEPHRQTLLFCGGGENFRFRWFVVRWREVENCGGKFIRLRPRVGQRALADQQVADFGLGGLRRLGVRKIIQPQLAVIHVHDFVEIGFGQFRLGLREKIGQVELDVIDLHAVGHAVLRQIIRVKLRD